MAADVSAGADRRMPARREMGACRRCALAGRELSADLGDRQSDAAGCAPAVHGSGARGLCARFGTVHKEDRGERSLGVSGSHPRADHRQRRILRTRRADAAFHRFYARDDLGTDQNRFRRHRSAGGSRAAHHHRTAHRPDAG